MQLIDEVAIRKTEVALLNKIGDNQ